MQVRQEARPRAKSAFVAAFLSLIFPGLGQAYAGAYARALTIAAIPILFLALVGGIGLRMDRLELLGFIVQPWVLQSIFVLNVIALAYRGAAIVDAWRLVVYMNSAVAAGGGRLGGPRVRWSAASLAGLVAILLVMAGAHVAVARYDLQAMALVDCVFDEDGSADCGDSASASPTPTGSADPDASEEPSLVPSPSPGASAAPTDEALPPWDGKERLNILLIGSDEREGTAGKRTDTLIVASIDPATRRVALFSLPRDTVDVPLPAGPARSVFGSAFAGKINGLYGAAVARPDLFPGNDNVRGYNAVKAALGELYGIDIRWYIEVNFDGFRRVVDALGGVTINVQLPVSDDAYPGDDGLGRRVYIPAGVQHMTGSEALIYARSRHGSNDFDRAARQQRVLVSLREQTDIATIVPRLDELVAALSSTIRTDIPISELPKLLSLADGVDTRDLRSYVFAPSYWAEERRSGDPRGYVIVPRVDRIRAAAQGVFSFDPQLEETRDAITDEGAKVIVLNGSGVRNQAGEIARYLDYWGVDASASSQRPETSPANVSIVAYNGAETAFPQTLALLERVYATTVVAQADPAARADFVIVTAKDMPNPTPPAAP